MDFLNIHNDRSLDEYPWYEELSEEIRKRVETRARQIFGLQSEAQLFSAFTANLATFRSDVDLNLTLPVFAPSRRLKQQQMQAVANMIRGINGMRQVKVIYAHVWVIQSSYRV